jgi:hypothetical protein
MTRATWSRREELDAVEKLAQDATASTVELATRAQRAVGTLEGRIDTSDAKIKELEDLTRTLTRTVARRLDLIAASRPPPVAQEIRLGAAQWNWSPLKQYEWIKIGHSGIDVSTNYVLLNAAGHVIGLDAGGSVTKLPYPQHDSDFFEMGEFLNRPVILNRKDQAYWFDGENWRLINTHLKKLEYAGDGWLVVVAYAGIRHLVWLGFDQYGTPSTSLDGSPIGTAEQILGIGGSRSDPLVITKLPGQQESLPRLRGRRGDWFTTDQWEPRGPVASISDINAYGVIIVNFAAYRWVGANAGWWQLPGAGTRIGGTYQNPILVGGGGEIYRYPDSQ